MATPTVALTGGIASGKSSAATEFARLGVPVIDTDEIARSVVEPGRPALDAIVKRFGKNVLDETGQLDRKQLRQRIFADSAEKQALETILHPAIRAEQLRRSATAGGHYQLHVIPLLAETGTQDRYDRVLLVDCSPETQLQRLITRDGISHELATQMIAAQATREQRRVIADDVINNDGDPAHLAYEVARLHRHYLKDLAKAP